MMEYRILRLSAVAPDTFVQWFSEADRENQARLRSLRSPQAQKQSLAADHLARTMLRPYCGQAPLLLLRDAQGKPYAPDVSACFSLSHAGDFAACALHSLNVGIDIETPRTVRPQLAQRICAPQELEFIYANSTFDSMRFLQVWTAKEAYLKYLGCGIRRELREIVTLTADGAPCLSGLVLAAEQTDEYILSVVYEPAPAHFSSSTRT